MKKIFIGLMLVLGLFIMPVRTEAAAESRVITANPGEDASSMINISWIMDASKAYGKVKYTKKTDTNWQKAKSVMGEKELVTLYTDIDNFYHYYVELKDLEPGTEYMYQVGQDVMSETYYFKTAGGDSFKFLWVSDWHAYGPLPARTDSHASVVSKCLAKEPGIDFIFSTGDDLAYGSDHDAQLYVYNKPYYKTHLFATTVGNHDVMHVIYKPTRKDYPNTDEFFKKTHRHPQNGYAGQEGASYYFKYGPALFIVLNNEDINYGHGNKETGLAKAKAWTKEVIEQNPSQYIFVAMHYQWFDGRTGKTSAQYTDWRTFFDENNVDLAMAGNNHVYLRTKGRIYNDASTGTNQGTVYMQAPSSDGERGVQHGDIQYNGHIIEEMWSQGTKTIGAIIMDVTPEGISHQLIDNNSNVIAESSFTSRYANYEFDKEAFLNSFETYSVNDDKVIYAPAEGIKFVERIEYYNNDDLVGTNYFYQLKDTSYKLTQPDLNNLKAVVKFMDGTTGETALASDDSYYCLENVRVDLRGIDLELSWEYNGVKDFNLYVFNEDVLVGEVGVNEKSLVIERYDLDSVFTIKSSLTSTNAYYNVRYNEMADGNFDGLVNEGDAIIILAYLNGDLILNARQKAMLDIDNDGEITIIDLTYVHLYANGNSDILTKETYTVKFYDETGTLMETIEVVRGSDVIPPDYVLEGDVIFIGWDKNLNNVSADLEVRPIILR